MESFVTSGSVVWVILAIMMVEAVVLIKLIKAFPGILAGLLAGGFIVLALGAALAGFGAVAIASCLGFSFLCHAAELYFWLKLRPHAPS